MAWGVGQGCCDTGAGGVLNAQQQNIQKNSKGQLLRPAHTHVYA
jgi:hypothetical protein